MTNKHNGKYFKEATVITGSGIKLYKFLARKEALRLETKGMKRSRGPTAYSICKQVYGLKGTRQRVLEQMDEMATRINPQTIDKILKTEK